MGAKFKKKEYKKTNKMKHCVCYMGTPHYYLDKVPLFELFFCFFQLTPEQLRQRTSGVVQAGISVPRVRGAHRAGVRRVPSTFPCARALGRHLYAHLQHGAGGGVGVLLPVRGAPVPLRQERPGDADAAALLGRAASSKDKG